MSGTPALRSAAGRAPHRRQREALELARREQPRPGLEQHERLGAGLRLRGKVRRHGVRQMRRAGAWPTRLRVEEGARGGELLGRTAADEVAQQRKGRAGEADERHAARHAGAHQADRLEHERHVALGHERRQRLDLRIAADGLAHDGPGLEVDVHAHALQRGHDVAEQDRRVQLEAAQRLQGHLRGELRGAREGREIDPARAARGTRAGSAPPGA